MIKKLTACFLATAMLISAVPVIAAVQTYHIVYDLNFDGGDISSITAAKQNVSSVEGGTNGSKALFVDKPASEEEIPYFNLKYLNRMSYSRISINVKPVTEDTNANVKLVVTINEGGKKTDYVLEQKVANINSWTTLSNTLHTKYKALMEAPQVKVIVTDSNGMCSYMLDDFLVESDEPTQEKYNEVPEINNNGNYTYRASFETDTIESFKFDQYTMQIPEFYCTDEIVPHSGKQSLLVTGRGYYDSTITIMLPGVNPKSKIEVSCWVHNAPGVLEETYYIRDFFKVNGKLRCHRIGDFVTVKGDEWVKMTASIDLSQLALTDTPAIQIMTYDNGEIGPFYVDDIVVTSDMPGESYDDMNYVEPERGEGLSDTAYRYIPKYTPVQQDIPSLKDVFKDYFKIGMAVQEKALGAEGNRYFELIKKHCNQLTGEGSMKANYIITNTADGKGYKWDWGNELSDFAYRNGFELVGHVLTWEQASFHVQTQDTEGNFLSRDELLAYLKEYITKVITHFEGDGDASEYVGYTDYKNWHVPVWDVVNEAAKENTEDLFSSRGSGLKAILGKDWVRYAFWYADDVGYDDIEFRYNDFGEQNEDKLNAICTVIDYIIDGDCRLDIIGLQSHYNSETTSAMVRRAVERLAAFGKKLDVTELDMRVITDAEIKSKTNKYELGVTKEAEFYQANFYYDIFELYKEYSDIIDRVTLWSLTDKLSSCNDTNGFKHTDYGTVFDRSMQAKPQYWAIVDSEYYFNEILKEDKSKLRVAYDRSTVAFEDSEWFEQNSVKYLNIDKLLSVFNDLKYSINSDFVSIIKDGIYYEMDFNSNKITAGGKDYSFSSELIKKDDGMYVSCDDVCKMLEYAASFSEGRNLITISSYQRGDILDAI